MASGLSEESSQLQFYIIPVVLSSTSIQKTEDITCLSCLALCEKRCTNPYPLASHAEAHIEEHRPDRKYKMCACVYQSLYLYYDYHSFCLLTKSGFLKSVVCVVSFNQVCQTTSVVVTGTYQDIRYTGEILVLKTITAKRKVSKPPMSPTQTTKRF